MDADQKLLVVVDENADLSKAITNHFEGLCRVEMCSTPSEAYSIGLRAREKACVVVLNLDTHAHHAKPIDTFCGDGWSAVETIEGLRRHSSLGRFRVLVVIPAGGNSSKYYSIGAHSVLQTTEPRTDGLLKSIRTQFSYVDPSGAWNETVQSSQCDHWKAEVISPTRLELDGHYRSGRYKVVVDEVEYWVTENAFAGLTKLAVQKLATGTDSVEMSPQLATSIEHDTRRGLLTRIGKKHCKLAIPADGIVLDTEILNIARDLVDTQTLNLVEQAIQRDQPKAPSLSRDTLVQLLIAGLGITAALLSVVSAFAAALG